MNVVFPFPAASRKLDQARKCWDAARAMIDRSPELTARSTVYTSRNELRIEFGSGVFKALATGSVDDLQGENPSLALVDEIGFLPAGVWGAMVARGVKRRRPLVAGMGTPGFDQGTMWELRERALSAPVPGFLWTEYSAADGCALDDMRAWRRANPMLAEDRMNPQALVSSLHQMTENEFRAYHLAQWTGGQNPYLPPGASDLLDVEAAPPAGVDVVLGFDGSDTGDWSALCGCTLDHDRPHVFVIRAWNPAAHEGRIPRRDVLSEIHQAFARWQVVELAADPFGWATEIDDLASIYPGRVTRWPVSRVRIASAADRFRGHVLDRRLITDGSPLLLQHLANCQAELTPDGPVIAKRKASGTPIDVAVSAMIAVDRASQLEAPRPAPRPRIL
jgi:phage terminase large subunit-like protein